MSRQLIPIKLPALGATAIRHDGQKESAAIGAFLTSEPYAGRFRRLASLPHYASQYKPAVPVQLPSRNDFSLSERLG